MAMEKYNSGGGLFPEWAKQEAVILAWPNECMDWRDNLDEVRACYLEIIDAILNHTRVVLLMDREEDFPRDSLAAFSQKPFRLVIVSRFLLNDTWMRDVMPLFGMQEESKVAHDFGFNGWGLKFPANHDNTAVRRLFGKRVLFHPGDDSGEGRVLLLPRQDYILEGGAIEYDGRGTVMTTDSVLCEPNRNVHSEDRGYQIEQLKETFSVPNVQSLGVHAMRGDDTDGHIDTLARFVDAKTVVYNYSDDTNDVHYHLLQSLKDEVEAMRDVEGEPYRCVPLPIPAPMYDDEGMQLPATYANFLITNGAVLVPVYQDPMDEVALKVLREVMPEYKIIGIDCRALVQQHGSLHCITMQVPAGFLNPIYL